MFFNQKKEEFVKNQIGSSLKEIKEELDEHLISVNQNTNEIQTNYEYLCELDSKIEKLKERLDEITVFLGISHPKSDYKISPLTKNEKEVFLVLYTRGEEKDYLTYKEIARYLALSKELVMNYITNIIEKGIPIIKRYADNKVYIKLDPNFKSLQAKENLVKIDEEISAELSRPNILIKNKKI
tara:strand:+ start:987 stop:1535 length:549 start_codon:yes stop_codon:yes gene_type:complete